MSHVSQCTKGFAPIRELCTDFSPLINRWWMNRTRLHEPIGLRAKKNCYPSAFPTILHSKGRITYLPSFSEILEDHIILLTCTSPLIAIALQKGTSIAYPILWRQQIQLCLNTVRRVKCHLSQESSPTSSPWPATLGRENEKPNNRSKTQEQQTQSASTPTAPPQRPVFFFWWNVRREGGEANVGCSDTRMRAAKP